MFALLLTVMLTGATVDAEKAEADYTGMIWVHAEVCPRCKEMRPTVDKLLMEGKPIIVAKVTYQTELDQYGVQFVPATIVYLHGKRVGSATGLVSEEDMRKKLGQLRQGGKTNGQRN